MEQKYSHLSTLPEMAALGSHDRSALLAGLLFVEGVANGWGRAELIDWRDQHLIATGRMSRMRAVHEAVVGTIPLSPTEDVTPMTGLYAPLGQLPKLLMMARSRVLVTLRAFVAMHTDDRFLSGAIFAERVMRTNVADRSIWVARPNEKDLLSDIVLSLFSADVLMHRVFHERSLCVCDVCGRISFYPVETSRQGCVEHRPRSGVSSGFIQRWVDDERAVVPPASSVEGPPRAPRASRR